MTRGRALSSVAPHPTPRPGFDNTRLSSTADKAPEDAGARLSAAQWDAILPGIRAQEAASGNRRTFRTKPDELDRRAASIAAGAPPPPDDDSDGLPAKRLDEVTLEEWRAALPAVHARLRRRKAEGLDTTALTPEQAIDARVAAFKAHDRTIPRMRPATVSPPGKQASAPVAARMERLHKGYREAMMARAMKAAGVTAAPTLDDLAGTEAAPEAIHVTVEEFQPDVFKRLVKAEAIRIAGSRAWREAQPAVMGRHQRMKAARAAVDEEKLRPLATRTVRTMANRREYEAGQALVAKWGKLVATLRGLLDVVQKRIPDLWLASLSEADLRAAAEVAAQLALMTTPADEMDEPRQRRARCPMHQRKALRRRASKARQHLAALLGTIGHGAAPYADAYVTSCWRERQDAAKAYGLANELVFEDGATVSLWEVMESSRKARLAAL